MKKKPTLLIGLIFFLSGVSSLIYQVVWQRLLTISYGSGSVSILIIVTVFLLGLGLGSLLAATLSRKFLSTGKAYASLEIVIGIFGLLSPAILQFLYNQTAGSSYVLTAILVSAFLLIPTICMGAGLPFLVKAFNAHEESFTKSISVLYFINTLGAAAGCLLCAYFLIGKIGLDGSIYFAAFINIVLAISSYLIFSKPQKEKNPTQEVIPELNIMNVSKLSLKKIYLLVFITGFLATAYEICWFRINAVIIKDSAYAFATILSVYLIGIAIGSFGIQQFLNRKPEWKGKKITLFYFLQLSIAASIAFTFLLFIWFSKSGFIKSWIDITSGAVIWPIVNEHKTFLYNAKYMLWAPLWFILVPSIFMGASFPIISSLTFNRSKDAVAATGKVYFYNILGNVIGSLSTGLVFFPVFHIALTIKILLSGTLIIVLLLRQFVKNKIIIRLEWMSLGAVLVCIFVLPGFEDFYKNIHRFSRGEAVAEFHVDEGYDAVVANYTKAELMKLFINGVGHGENPTLAYHARVVEAMSYSPNGDTICVIGFGSGNTIEAIRMNPDVKKIYVVEIAPSLIENLRDYTYTREDINDPRITIINDDARRFLQRTTIQFDLILMDPVRSKSAYSNNLYSYEFFNLCKTHLKKKGMLQCWYDNEIVAATCCKSFPYYRVYKDFVLLSSTEIVNENYKTRYNNFAKNYEGTEAVHHFFEVFPESFLFSEKNTKDNFKFLPINTDRRPACEYYLSKR